MPYAIWYIWAIATYEGCTVWQENCVTVRAKNLWTWIRITTKAAVLVLHCLDAFIRLAPVRCSFRVLCESCECVLHGVYVFAWFVHNVEAIHRETMCLYIIYIYLSMYINNESIRPCFRSFSWVYNATMDARRWWNTLCWATDGSTGSNYSWSSP